MRARASGAGVGRSTAVGRTVVRSTVVSGAVIGRAIVGTTAAGVALPSGRVVVLSSSVVSGTVVGRAIVSGTVVSAGISSSGGLRLLASQCDSCPVVGLGIAKSAAAITAYMSVEALRVEKVETYRSWATTGPAHLPDLKPQQPDAQSASEVQAPVMNWVP